VNLEEGKVRRAEEEGEDIVGTLGSFALNTSILLRKRMIEVRKNHRELMTDSKRTRDSAIRFYPLISGSLVGCCLGDRATHLVLLLEQDLIIFRQCGTEDNTCDALEIVDPLLTF
jgi:hypothetical protein